MGAPIAAEQAILALWGGTPVAVPRPALRQCALVIGDVAIEIYRLFAFGLGLSVYFGLHLVLNRTRIGLLIRAGVENREMVEALGFRVDRLIVGVFVLGSAPAARDGAIWAGYETLITPALGAERMIVVIIGGLGSIQGTLLGAIMFGLVANCTGFLAPKMALASNMILMMAILLWRPTG